MDDLYGADNHLEAAYEDANGAALPEHREVEIDEDEEFWDDDYDVNWHEEKG
jgi:hypothetical protein